METSYMYKVNFYHSYFYNNLIRTHVVSLSSGIWMKFDFIRSGQIIIRLGLNDTKTQSACIIIKIYVQFGK